LIPGRGRGRPAIHSIPATAAGPAIPRIVCGIRRPSRRIPRRPLGKRRIWSRSVFRVRLFPASSVPLWI